MKKIIIPPTFLFLSLFLIILFYFLLPGYNVVPFPYNFAGLLVLFFGFALMGRSRDLFKKHQTTLKFEKSNFLVTEGVFSKTRNPMYLGMFLLLLGFSVCFMNLFSMVTAFCFLGLVNFLFIPNEEKWMRDTFGESYLDYKKRVRRWF